MATEVLLMTDVPDLGAEGSVVKVADGYARNYLLPKGLASPVNAAARARLGKLRKQRELALAESRKEAEGMQARLEGVSCTIAVKTGEEGQLYGSVSATEIIAALEAQGVKIDRHALVLEHPIKELGVFDVKVALHPDVDTTVKVWVVEE